ncbi:hypothetical protein GVAV_001628 [Gurleya vavrai]
MIIIANNNISPEDFCNEILQNFNLDKKTISKFNNSLLKIIEFAYENIFTVDTKNNLNNISYLKIKINFINEKIFKDNNIIKVIPEAYESTVRNLIKNNIDFFYDIIGMCFDDFKKRLILLDNFLNKDRKLEYIKKFSGTQKNSIKKNREIELVSIFTREQKILYNELHTSLETIKSAKKNFFFNNSATFDSESSSDEDHDSSILYFVSYDDKNFTSKKKNSHKQAQNSSHKINNRDEQSRQVASKFRLQKKFNQQNQKEKTKNTFKSTEVVETKTMTKSQIEKFIADESSNSTRQNNNKQGGKIKRNTTKKSVQNKKTMPHSVQNNLKTIKTNSSNLSSSGLSFKDSHSKEYTANINSNNPFALLEENAKPPTSLKGDKGSQKQTIAKLPPNFDHKDKIFNPAVPSTEVNSDVNSHYQKAAKLSNNSNNEKIANVQKQARLSTNSHNNNSNNQKPTKSANNFHNNSNNKKSAESSSNSYINSNNQKPAKLSSDTVYDYSVSNSEPAASSKIPNNNNNLSSLNLEDPLTVFSNNKTFFKSLKSSEIINNLNKFDRDNYSNLKESSEIINFKDFLNLQKIENDEKNTEPSQIASSSQKNNNKPLIETEEQRYEPEKDLITVFSKVKILASGYKINEICNICQKDPCICRKT